MVNKLIVILMSPKATEESLSSIVIPAASGNLVSGQIVWIPNQVGNDKQRSLTEFTLSKANVFRMTKIIWNNS